MSRSGWSDRRGLNYIVGNFRPERRQHAGMPRTMGRVMIELIASHLVGAIARMRQMIP